ncbi:MAG: CvpA family protein [Planctomycetes bacterium]|jgi:hypothetical protein|nr:CvpA family protein [Planctomycetota bacterium]
MVFWLAILAGTLFVWLAVRAGFYDTWVLFFNIAVSIYVSIFVTPLLAEAVPPPGGAAAYHVALCMIVLAGACFALLEGLSYVFLTGQFHIPFPRVFDVVLAGLLGFVAGFLVLSFAALIVTTTPLAGHRIAGVFALGPGARQANLVGLTRCGDLIHAFAGLDEDTGATARAVQRLRDVKVAGPELAPKPSEVNEPSATPAPAGAPSGTRRLRGRDLPE